MSFEIETLENGMRVICSPSNSDVVYCGVVVDAGTRDELPEESGMAHFTEHMSFKGTTHRRSWSIINRMESVGGDLNAYTGKEETVYYCAVPLRHYVRAVDLLVDIVFNSTYPQREMDKEVEVVIDEIESYNDNPSELIFDEFEGLVFRNHPLGRNILGDAERLRSFQSSDMRRYADRLYRPERMVLYLYGNVSMKDLLRVVRRSVTDKASESRQPVLRIPPVTGYDATLYKQKRDTHQAHVMLGTRAFAATDVRYLHLYLLNNILGGPGMNSRLNLSLRERRGLVYMVESNVSCYTDTGIWSTYFGCDAHDVERCLRLIRKELQHLTDAPLSERVLSAAKRQLKGQIGISYDNHENVAIGMGKRLLHYGKTLSRQQLCDQLDALSAQDLWQTAQDVFAPERLITLVYE